MNKKIDFTTFCLSISSAALMHLGIVPPGSGLQPKIDLEQARHNIDLLELMEEKTKGNLTPDEATLASQLLYQVRMRYVEVETELRQNGKIKI